MPRDTMATHPIELWTQICLPSSEGLRGALPQSAEAEGETTSGDVKEGKLPVLFTVDPVTSNVLPAHLLIEVQAPDFVPAQSRQEVLLPHSRDSGILVFTLTATGDRDRAKVYVTLRQQVEGTSVFTLGSLVLVTNIKTSDAKGIIDPVWTLVNRLLGSLPPAPTHSVGSNVNASQNTDGRAHFELKVVEDAEKRRIEKYLKLDVPLLCSLIPLSGKDTLFNPSGQIARGQDLLEELKPAIQASLCSAWHLCEKIPDETYIDEVELIATIADVISPVVHDIPATLIATILVKLGIRKFCECQGQESSWSQMDTLHLLANGKGGKETRS